MSRVLVISSSLRRRSNSELLAKEFARGAEQSGNTVEFVSLRDRQIGYCIGCLACQKTGRCVLKDDKALLCEQMRAADVLVFASPIYYYEMSGQLKTMLDRANPLYGSDYHFKKVYFLSTATDTDPKTPSRAITGLGGWIECFERAEFAGSVFCGGVTDPGEIEGSEALQKAYALGAGV